MSRKPNYKLDELKIRQPCIINRPVAYRFVFSGSGWAVFTLNDDTGEFSVQSDWGNYSYRWNVTSLGKDKDGKYFTLHKFLTHCSPEYIADKFSYENKHDLANVYDEEETEKHVRQSVREWLDDCTNEHVKEKIEEELEDLVFDDGVDEFLRSVEKTDQISSFIDYEDVHYMRSGRWMMLTERLLPFFQQYLKENVLNQESTPEAVQP